MTCFLFNVSNVFKRARTVCIRTENQSLASLSGRHVLERVTRHGRVRTRPSGAKRFLTRAFSLDRRLPRIPLRPPRSFVTIAFCSVQFELYPPGTTRIVPMHCPHCRGVHQILRFNHVFGRQKHDWAVIISFSLRVFNFFAFFLASRQKLFAICVFAKAYSTRRFSRAVPHHGTCRALTGLTSEFRWDRVYS